MFLTNVSSISIMGINNGLASKSLEKMYKKSNVFTFKFGFMFNEHF